MARKPFLWQNAVPHVGVPKGGWAAYSFLRLQARRGVGFEKLWKTHPKSRRAKPRGIFLPRGGSRWPIALGARAAAAPGSLSSRLRRSKGRGDSVPTPLPPLKRWTKLFISLYRPGCGSLTAPGRCRGSGIWWRSAAPGPWDPGRGASGWRCQSPPPGRTPRRR